MEEKVILYSSKTCPKCKILERKLIEKGVKFEKCDDMTELEKRKIYSLPVLRIGDKFLNYVEAFQKFI